MTYLIQCSGSSNCSNKPVHGSKDIVRYFGLYVCLWQSVNVSVSRERAMTLCIYIMQDCSLSSMMEREVDGDLMEISVAT